MFNGNSSPEAVRRETQMTCWATDIEPQNVIIKEVMELKDVPDAIFPARLEERYLCPQTLQIPFWASKWFSWYWIWAIASAGNSVLNFPHCVSAHTCHRSHWDTLQPYAPHWRKLMSQAVWRVSVVAWLQGTGLQVYIICREYTSQERDTDSGSLVCLQTVLLPWKGSNIW